MGKKRDTKADYLCRVWLVLELCCTHSCMPTMCTFEETKVKCLNFRGKFISYDCSGCAWWFPCRQTEIWFECSYVNLKNIFQEFRGRGKKSHYLLLLSIHTTKANISQEADTLHLTIRQQPHRKGWALGIAPEGKRFLERTHCYWIWVFRLPVLHWSICGSLGAGMGHPCHLHYLTIIVSVI